VLIQIPQIGFQNLEIHASTLPESLSKTALSPLEYVLQTASQKATHIYQQSLATASSPPSLKDPSLVIAADTVVVTASGAILEKPRSEAHHISMLKMLRDQGSHKVFTAVVVMAPREDARAPGYGIKTFVEETTVLFDQSLSNEFLEAYVRTREAVGMAGGYGIQGMGSLLVERVEGSWDNVVGLPGRVVLRLVEELLGDVSREGDEGSEDEEE
jgi:MAF protein